MSKLWWSSAKTPACETFARQPKEVKHIRSRVAVAVAVAVAVTQCSLSWLCWRLPVSSVDVDC